MIVACALFANAPSAHDGEHHHGQGTKGAARPSLATGAAFDALGNLWTVSFDGPNLVVRRSADLGLHWTAPVRVRPEAEPIDTGADAKPNIAIGPGGEIYVTWTKPLSKPYTGEIRLTRSIDGGKSFSEPRVVHADRQEITHRFDAMAVTSDGRLLVAWIDKRDGMAVGGKASHYAGAATYYAVSDDRGLSFRGDYKIADHSCECCRIALLPRPDGSVIGFWRQVFPPNVRDHAVATL
ncbi:MAG TPA: sialidase family protein, partial [Burkholderiaceae bacterium]|nr:sialidase family protein [Burkholderiaceae bacterium]